MIYLDNAATTFPKPASVLQAVKCCQQCYAANPGRAGHALAAKADETVFETRQTLAAFFGGDVQRTAFCFNCTHAINTALKGILQKGDHVIISSLEHNAVLRPLEQLRQSGIITYDVLQVAPKDDAVTLQRTAALIQTQTRLLFVTHVSNVFGTVLPVSKLASLAHAHGILFGVDAAQSGGVFDLNMQTDAVDLLCVPGHKGLFGPMGTGALLFSNRVTPAPLLQGGTGSLSLEKKQPDVLPDKFESGTLNLPGIAGLGAGLRFVNQTGTAAIRSHEAQLITLLREDLSVVSGVRIYDEMRSLQPQTLLSFSVESVPSEEVGSALNRVGFAVRAGFHCAALAHTMQNSTESGTVRVSPSIFNSKKQIKNLSFYINQIAKRHFLC